MVRLTKVVTAAVLGFFAFSSSAWADSFVVNVTDDSDDGVCADLPGGDCTLREAINAVNAAGSFNSISIEIPAAVDDTITLSSQLPTITENLSMTSTFDDGVVTLDGNGTVANGLAYSGSAADSNLTVLDMKDFTSTAVSTAGGATSLDIVFVNVTGTPTPFSIGADGADIFGSYLVGPGSTGTGIDLNANANVVNSNDITGFQTGIAIDGNDNEIGDPPVFNIGANVIYGNQRGIVVSSGSDNLIYSNEVYDNAIIGIDLAATPGVPDGVTANDGPADSDSGANGLQNFPVIDTASDLGTDVSVTGTLPASGGPATIIFYYSETCSPTGNGEGAVVIGHSIINPAPGGEEAVFTLQEPAGATVSFVEPGGFITATAENGAGTSEYSKCKQVIDGPSIDEEEIVAGEVDGNVLVKRPSDGGFEPFTGQELLPEGTIFDTKNGEVRIVSEAPDEENGVREAAYSQGEFKITQEDSGDFLTVATLTGGKKCGGKSKDKKGKLLFRGKGKHKNNGKHGAGTVRGTEFLTENKCGSTQFKVNEGSVTVRDFAKKKNVTVDAGESYTAKAKKKKG